jgi:hypothetical protein
MGGAALSITYHTRANGSKANVSNFHQWVCLQMLVYDEKYSNLKEKRTGTPHFIEKCSNSLEIICSPLPVAAA